MVLLISTKPIQAVAVHNRLARRLEQQQHTQVDLSPLLDVVFILLIFFIVTTVFVKETGIEVDKPTALSTQQLQRNVVLFAISGDGKVMYDGANVGVMGVRNIVAQSLTGEQRAVVVQTDRNASADLLVKVVDQAKLAGAASVNVATQAP